MSKKRRDTDFLADINEAIDWISFYDNLILNSRLGYQKYHDAGVGTNHQDELSQKGCFPCHACLTLKECKNINF